MTINMCIAAIAWIALTIGLVKRHERESHVPCMLGGIALDFLLVLYLQVTRDAVQQAAGFSLPLLHQVHIFFSLLAMVCYIPTLFLGFKLLKGDMAIKDVHIKVALAAYVFRTLGLLFMFSLI